MKKKDSVNLDSLLDVLTNVVGFLVIVMAVLQINISHGVQGAQRENIEKSIDQMRKDAERYSRLAREQKQQIEDDDSGSGYISGGDTDVDQIRVDWQRSQSQITSLQDEIEDLSADYHSLSQQLEDLGGPVGDRPAVKLPSIKILRRTSSGSSPRSWERKDTVVIICHAGRAFVVDVKEIEKIWTAVLQDAINASSFYASDLPKISAFLGKNDRGNEFFRLQVSGQDLVIDFRSDAPGSTQRELVAGNGRLATALRQTLAPDKAWLKFLVWEGSFDTYAAARDLAENLGYQVGWIPFSRDSEYRESLVASGAGGQTDGPQE